MARYYVSDDDDLATVAAELIAAADDPRDVVYVIDGANGAFDVPDDLAESYHAKTSTPRRGRRTPAPKTTEE